MQTLPRSSTAALLFSLLIAFSSSAEAASLTSKIKKAGSDIIESARQNPTTATAIAIGVPLFLYLVWPDAHRNRAAPAAAAIAAAARGVNPPPPPPAQGANPRAHSRIEAMSEQQMLELALKKSAQEAKPFQDLNMGAGDYHFNLEIFQPFTQIKTVQERVKYLQRILYEHDQRFMQHADLMTFAEVSYGLNTAELVTLFHQLSSEYHSLLAFDPSVSEIDPEVPPALSFDDLVHEYEIIRELRTTNAPHSDAQQIVDRRKRQPIEDRILLLVIAYFFEHPNQASKEKASLAIEHLFGDAEGLALAKKEVQLTEAELRERRVARFEKIKKRSNASVNWPTT